MNMQDAVNEAIDIMKSVDQKIDEYYGQGYARMHPELLHGVMELVLALTAENE